MTSPRDILADARTAVWHLRHGGLRQARAWARRRSITMQGMAFPHSREQLSPPSFPPWPLPDRAPRRPGLRVGVILDDFSRLALRYEWEQVLLSPQRWRQEVADPRPIDMLFVESAWQGNNGAWQFALTGAHAPSHELVELVEWCRQQEIPTVFWNKEDPVHYTDFLDTARMFDYVWTTDSERVGSYTADLGHNRVGVLPFGAQQSIHNPVRPSCGHQERDVAFAGMYFAHKYPERRAQMDLLLGAANRVSKRMRYGLEIFSRHFGGDVRYQFPDSLAPRVVGSLSYEQMLSAYRGYKVFLNVNSVVSSPSMCARRIFEITATGTPVISTPSPAIERFFSRDEVLQVSASQEAEWALRALVNSSELRDRMVHQAQRRIWAEHTYTHRMEEVLTQAGVAEHRAPRPTVSALVASNRPHQLGHVLETMALQTDVALEVIILTHGFEVDAVARSHAAKFGLDNMVWLSATDDVPLGSCLNRLVAAASGDVVAKIDDDDIYGVHYLRDQLNALDYSGADIVGKRAHHMYLESRDLTILRFPEWEHRFTDFVAGATLVTRRDVARECPFPDLPRGEDTAFLRKITASGGTVYSSDRFNFLVLRNDNASHTWETNDLELLANARVVTVGQHRSHIHV